MSMVLTIVGGVLSCAIIIIVATWKRYYTKGENISFSFSLLYLFK